MAGRGESWWGLRSFKRGSYTYWVLSFLSKIWLTSCFAYSPWNKWPPYFCCGWWVINLNWFIFLNGGVFELLDSPKYESVFLFISCLSVVLDHHQRQLFLAEVQLDYFGPEKMTRKCNILWFFLFCFGYRYSLSKMYGFLKTDLSDMSAHQKLWQIIHKRSHYPFATTITTFFSLTLYIFSGILLWRRARSQ